MILKTFRKKVIAKKSWLGNVKTFFEKYRLAILVFRIYFNYRISTYTIEEKKSPGDKFTKEEIPGSYVTWNIKDNLLSWFFSNSISEIIILIINIINEIAKDKIIDTKYLNIFLLYNLLGTFLDLELFVIKKIFPTERNSETLIQNANNLHPVKNIFLLARLWNI